MALWRTPVVFLPGLFLYSPVCSLAFPQTTGSDTLSSNSSITPAYTAVPPYTLSPECLSNITTYLPNQQTWQACNTTGWLEDLINGNNATFRNPAFLQANGGFIGAFSKATKHDISCTYGQTCSVYPTYPPAAHTSADDTQKIIVQTTLFYLSSWYEAANDMLIKEEILNLAFEGDVVQKLIMQALPAAQNTGVSMGSMFNLVGSVLSIIPNPYTKVAGVLLKGISALMPTPSASDPDAGELAEIVAVGNLTSQLSTQSGVAFSLASEALSTRFMQLFISDVDPMSDEGMFTMLQDGEPTADLVAYNWIVSQVLQTQRVFLHALVVSECPSTTLGIQGNNCASYEGVNFVYWPAIWNAAAPATVPIPAGEWNEPMPVATMVQDLTRHPNGGLIFSELIPGLNVTVNANFLFQTSLLCQLSANTQNDLLATWPMAPANTIFSDSADASCLYNLPIVIDEQEAFLPSDVGLLSSIITPSQACLQSPMTTFFYSQVQKYTGTDLQICGSAWSLDEYAAIALGLISDSDPTQYWYCGDLGADTGFGVACNGPPPNASPLIGGCGAPGLDGGCLCVQNAPNELSDWGYGAFEKCEF